MTIALGRRRRRMRLLSVLAVAWLCTGATKLPERGTAEEQEACTPDVFRLCSAEIPDEPQILACLESKREQLSPACGKVITPTPERQHRKRVKPAPS